MLLALAGLDPAVGDERRHVDAVPVGDPAQERVAEPEADLGEAAGQEQQDQQQPGPGDEQRDAVDARDRRRGTRAWTTIAPATPPASDVSPPITAATKTLTLGAMP